MFPLAVFLGVQINTIYLGQPDGSLRMVAPDLKTSGLPTGTRGDKVTPHIHHSQVEILRGTALIDGPAVAAVVIGERVLPGLINVTLRGRKDEYCINAKTYGCSAGESGDGPAGER